MAGVKKKHNKKQINKEDSLMKHYSIASDIGFYIRHYRQYEPRVLVFCVIEIVLASILPLIGIYLPKVALDLVTEGADIKHAMFVLGAFTIADMLLSCLYGAVRDGKYLYYNAQRSVIMGILFLKSLRVKYEYTELGRVKSIYWKAIQSLEMGDWSANNRAVTGTVSLVVSVISFFLYSGIIGNLNIWILIFVIALSLVNYVIGKRHIKFLEKMHARMAVDGKHMAAVKASMGNPNGAKDIRIFGMNHWLVKLREMVLDDMRATNTIYNRKISLYEKIQFVLAAVRDLCAYGFLVYQAITGNVTVGEFVLYFGAITGFSSFVGTIIDSVMELRAAANETDYVRTYLELPEQEENVRQAEQNGVKNNIDDVKTPIEIEFRNVTFTYKEADEEASSDNADEADNENQGEPNQGKTVFKNFNLTIHAGEKLALVGVNGAGKTTLVKLLCGMYEPDEGAILINGIDMRAFTPRDIYNVYSAVFQEHFIMPFTVGENIAMDRVENIDEERAWEALDKAGIKSVFEENGWTLKTYMTRTLFKSGVSLSGGQQQRLLLARALYKDAPVLVLDEPTAALDPIAESEVYDSYNKYSEGKTSVFISHRLASTRFSDRIIMLENGEIIESGTHEELMNMDGAYANMFKIQSSYYRDSTNKEV